MYSGTRWSRRREEANSLLLSNEHFTVDSMLVETWAGHKSFKGKDLRSPAARRPGYPDG
jgi:hypothetical protein